MKICVVGCGYVGLSLSILLSQKNNVVVTDIDQNKVKQINLRKSPIKDPEIKDYLLKKKLKLKATIDKKEAYENARYIIVATPTNFDNKTASFDTSIVEKVISEIVNINNESTIVIKSTVPLGFTEKMRGIYSKKNIIFSPEFLREGKALYDNLYPSRIVIGDKTIKGRQFAKLLTNSTYISKKKINIHLMESMEAEAVKLFSNTYLAMRVAFFNELDTFSEVNKVSSKDIISAVSDDPRIGNYYNNPSFGYGGYCLPKDTKQLLRTYKKIPNKLIKAVIDSNKTRKLFISNSIKKKYPKRIGVFRLAMKSGSDNFRDSAVLDLIKILKKQNLQIYLYEPLLKKSNIKNVLLINNFEQFISVSDLIIANRMSNKLIKVKNKVYTRDLFGEN